MKQKLSLSIIAICLFNLSFGQNREKYLEFRTEAQVLFENKKFEEAGLKYSKAFIVFGNQGETKDRYNAACAWAMAKKVDSSFVQLYEISKNGDYSNLNQIAIDQNLNFLHQDDRWEEIMEFVKKNNKEQKEANAKLDKRLVTLLDSIYILDYKYRRKIKQIEKKYGRDSEEIKYNSEMISKIDSTNLLLVKSILNDRGWLGVEKIGIRGNKTLFLVIQHSDFKTQIKYLPMMRKAEKKGNAEANDLAFLEDRVALRKEKKQIYGSQVARDKKTGEYFVMPLKKPKNVDKRRKKIGLNTLANYISFWNITWNVDEHKNRIKMLHK
jgi:hypothetical protein